MFIGAQLYLSGRREERERLDRNIERELVDGYESMLRDATGHEFAIRSAIGTRDGSLRPSVACSSA